MDQLPSILALVGVLLTVLVNLILGIVKSKAETKTVGNSAEKEFRDDLRELIERQDAQIIEKDNRLEKKDEVIGALNTKLGECLDQKLTLSLENKSLLSTNADLERKLSEHERKVFYRPEDKKQEQ